MTNDLAATEVIFDKADYKIMPILEIARTVKQELWKLHTTFGGFSLFHLPTEQLICQMNMLLQHYHTSTALSKKLDASFWYLQLQLDTPHNPLTLPFNKWGHLTPLLWVKMLWQSLDSFMIQLHMKYPTILYPRERDQVIMELAHDKASSPLEISSINRCQGMLQCIFLSDVVTADGRYLESFVFNPGLFRRRSSYRFPCEPPSQKDWETWFDFWHSYILMGDKLAVLLGKWINPTHRKWLWYTSPKEGLIRIEDGYVHHYLPSQGVRRTRSTPAFTLAWREDYARTSTPAYQFQYAVSMRCT
jgi:hypothetical protein